jgi:hypothetical protein
MTDTPDQPAEPTEPAVAPAPRRSFARRHWGKMTILMLLCIPAAIFALWAFITLSWSYSSGQRAGYVQKISHKGFVCKTWEGTLYTDIAKGFRSDSFAFTVRSDSIAHIIEGLSGKKVTLQVAQVDGRKKRISLTIEGKTLEGSKSDYQTFLKQSKKATGMGALAAALQRIQKSAD